jgi:hypothetical protein
MFAPATRCWNARSMETGRTFATNLEDLARALEGGYRIREPMNEWAHGSTRVFLELDGGGVEKLADGYNVVDPLEDTLVNQVLRMGYEPDTSKAIVRSNGNFHVTYYKMVMTCADYRTLIETLREEYPYVDQTCNDKAAWLRFPMTPKPGVGRLYHLVEGTYAQSFINPDPRPAKPQFTRRGIVSSEDERKVQAKWPGTRLAKRGYVDGTKRVYFSKGRAWCEWGQRWHQKRPITYRVGETVEQGPCKDHVCKRNRETK